MTMAIRIAIFTGAGEKAFSAGMDLKERAESGSSPIERRQQKLSATIHTQSSRGGGDYQTDDRGDPRLLRGWRA